MALLLRLRGKKDAPWADLALFEDPTLTFIGRGVGGDLAKQAGLGLQLRN